MSATDKLYYGGGSNRTMSLTSRPQSYSQGNPQRSMSMTNSMKYGKTHSRPAANSRTNSLNSNQGFGNGSIRRVSGGGSRSNSLTSNNSRTPSRIIKTTTTTTKEQDNSGRTRSITRTTVEQRGDVKIVRTTKTIITPGDDLEGDDPYEGFDDDIDMLMEPEMPDFDRPMTPVEEFDDEEEEERLDEVASKHQQSRVIAMGAAAAALGMSRQHNTTPKSPQVNFQQNNNVNNNRIKKEFTSPVIPQSPVQENHHAHFKEAPEMINYEADEATESPLSHDYHSGDLKYPPNEKEIEEEIKHEFKEEEQTEDDGHIYEAPMEDDEEIDFEELRRNRLSEIAEVTEPFDDLPDRTNGGAPVDSIIIRKPIEDSLELDDTIDMNRNIEETESEGEEYVEASEILDTPPQTTPMKVNNVGLGINHVDSSINSPAQHLYRNLLFTEKSASSPISSPRKNSIPKYQKNDYDLQKPLKFNINNEGDQSYLNTPPQSSDSVKSKPIKSSLKSTSTNASTVSNDIIPARMSLLPDTASLNSRLSQQKIPKKDLSPEEMYAIALKAAEKKVYGEEKARMVVDNTDIETLRNTQMNSQTSSLDRQQSVKQAPGYKSNAPSKFKIKSMRESIPSKKQSMEMGGQDTKELRKEMEQEAQMEKKKWEQERKLMLSNLRLDENHNFVTVDSPQPKAQQATPTKRNIFGFKKSPSHKHSNSVASNVSDTSTVKEKLFPSKKEAPQSIPEISNPIPYKPAEEHVKPPVVVSTAEPIKKVSSEVKPELKKEKKSKFGFKLKKFFDLN